MAELAPNELARLLTDPVANEEALRAHFELVGGCLPARSYPASGRLGPVTFPEQCFLSPEEKAAQQRERDRLIDEIIAAEVEGAFLDIAIEEATAPGANDDAAQELVLEEAAGLDEDLARLREAERDLQEVLGDETALERELRSLHARVLAATTLRGLGIAPRALPQAAGAPGPWPMAGWLKKAWRKVEKQVKRSFESVRDELQRVGKKALRSLARTAAVELAFRIVGTAVTFGAGAPLVQLAVSAGRRFGLDALPAVGQGVAGAATGQAAGVAVPENVLSLLQERSELVAELARTWGPWVAPDQVNDALQHIARLVAQIDVFDSLPGMALQELVLQAEESRRDRDELRLELARIRAEVAARGGVWLFVAKNSWQAVQSAVVTIATFGAAAPLVVAVQASQILVSAASAALAIANARQLAQAAEREMRARAAEAQREFDAERQRIEEEIAAMRAEIERLGLQAPASAHVELPPVVVALGGPFPLTVPALTATCCLDIEEALR